MSESDQPFIIATQSWLEHVVIGLNLCPFAKRELIKDRIAFTVCHSQQTAGLLASLEQQLTRLASTSEIETTLIIHPHVLQNFADYNDFLDHAEQLLIDKGYAGIIQIASFHPDYQFANTKKEDLENYTNRSPFPLIHLLKESSIEIAIANYPDSDQIPQQNIALMNALGKKKLQQLFKPVVAN